LLSRIAAREEEIEKEMNTRWHKVFIACHGAVLACNELEWRPLLADPQGGRRSLGAVLNDAVFVEGGCEGPQPSRPPPINIAAARMGIAGRSLEGAGPSAPC